METATLIKFRSGSIADLVSIKQLAIEEWSQFREQLTPENWENFEKSLNDDYLYLELINQSDSFICENEQAEIIGFAFLIPSGNPTDIYTAEQACIRFVTASKKYAGRKIGQLLTERCLEKARENGEQYVALHTSEMMDKARHIYEKLGFSVVRELDARMGKRYWLYELKLD